MVLRLRLRRRPLVIPAPVSQLRAQGAYLIHPWTNHEKHRYLLFYRFLTDKIIVAISLVEIKYSRKRPHELPRHPNNGFKEAFEAMGVLLVVGNGLPSVVLLLGWGRSQKKHRAEIHPRPGRHHNQFSQRARTIEVSRYPLDKESQPVIHTHESIHDQWPNSHATESVFSNNITRNRIVPSGLTIARKFSYNRYV